MRDYFEVLQIDENANASEIEKAYQEMLMKYPAEQYPAENNQIEKAYQLLMNPSLFDACRDFHCMNHASKQVYKLAEQSMEDGFYSEAIKILDKAIRTENHNTHLYYLLGIACLRTEKYTKAIKAFELLLNRYPYDTDLLLYLTEACIANENYKKAVTFAKTGYERNKDHVMFALFLAKGYLHTGKLAEAEGILKEAYQNPAFEEKKHRICARLVFILSLEKKFSESIQYMEMLPDIQTDNEEKLDSGDMLFNALDFYLENQMYLEANKCMSVIMKLLPDREDIVEAKKKIEMILELEPEFCRFEEDDTIPDGLVALIVNELFPETSEGMTERQREAYTVMNEYQLLHDYTEYLMPIRYMKNKYPNLYRLKEEFLNDMQNSKKRRILTTRYQALVYKYQDTFEELMEQWDEDYGDEYADEYDGEEPENLPDTKEKRSAELSGKKHGVTEEMSNIRPFIRKEDIAESKSTCSCGSGKQYKNCCGKKNKTHQDD